MYCLDTLSSYHLNTMEYLYTYSVHFYTVTQ
nr:MAG TPA: hypothetical protein [Caudoviricetes sp.]